MDKKVIGGLIAATCTMSVFLISNNALNSLRAKETAQQTEIIRLTEKLNGVEKSDITPDETLPEETLTPDEAEAASYSAAELGAQVAAYQNQYPSLDPSSDEFTVQVHALDACFSEGSKNARTPWYIGEIPGTWTFVTDEAFTGEKTDVLWLNRAEDGRLLAYATGTYLVSEHAFSNMSWEMSLTGAGSVSGSGVTPEESEAEQIGNLADQIKDITLPESETLSEDEMGAVKDAQDALRDAMKEEQKTGELMTQDSTESSTEASTEGSGGE